VNSAHDVLHDSILARTAKKLTQDGLVVRTRRTETFPPEVFYSLTQDGLEFLRLTEPAIAWVEEHAALIARAQENRRRPDGDGGTLGITDLDADLDDEDEE
jgi:DNA-binding HxlR family transcriptional regulator